MKSFALLLAYLAFVNLAGLYLMWNDKRRARRHAFRIPEMTLFAIALIGGSIGSLLGMYLFRHKTKHPSFVIGMPLILVLQLGLVVFLWLRADIRFL